MSCGLEQTHTFYTAQYDFLPLIHLPPTSQVQGLQPWTPTLSWKKSFELKYNISLSKDKDTLHLYIMDTI